MPITSCAIWQAELKLNQLGQTQMAYLFQQIFAAVQQATPFVSSCRCAGLD